MRKTGGIAILGGNLVPDGAVVKASAVAEDMLVFSGPAKVFDAEEEAIEVLLAGKIKDGDAVVVRYEGPKGGPGMREMLSATAIIAGMNLKVGRFSGVTRGACIGHICPEAADGGPVVLLKDGDMVHIDIPSRIVNVDISDADMAARKLPWAAPEPKVKSGYLARYARIVQSAKYGAVVRALAK